MWYYVHGNQRFGPVPREDIERFIRNGSLDAESLVWKEGMANWQPLRETELNSLAPLPAASAGSPYGPPRDQLLTFTPPTFSKVIFVISLIFGGLGLFGILYQIVALTALPQLLEGQPMWLNIGGLIISIPLTILVFLANIQLLRRKASGYKLGWAKVAFNFIALVFQLTSMLALDEVMAASMQGATMSPDEEQIFMTVMIVAYGVGALFYLPWIGLYILALRRWKNWFDTYSNAGPATPPAGAPQTSPSAAGGGTRPRPAPRADRIRSRTPPDPPPPAYRPR